MTFTATIKHPNSIYSHWVRMKYNKASIHGIVFTKRGNVFQSDNISPLQMELLKKVGASFSFITEPSGEAKARIMTPFREWAEKNNISYQIAYKKYKDGVLEAEVVKENGLLYVLE